MRKPQSGGILFVPDHRCDPASHFRNLPAAGVFVLTFHHLGEPRMKAMTRLAPDRGKIDITQGNQVRYWTRHLKVTPDKLLKAVEKVGPSVASVRKELSFTEPTPATEDVAVAAGK